MRTLKLLGGSALAAAAAATGVLVPSSPAGSATACVAWVSVPRHVHVHAVRATHVHLTLEATAGCAGGTFDNGATATMRGPGSSPNSVFPLQFDRIGGTDTLTLYAGINPSGRYRIAKGSLQTYDANAIRIPFTWRPTSTVVS